MFPTYADVISGTPARSRVGMAFPRISMREPVTEEALTFSAPFAAPGVWKGTSTQPTRAEVDVAFAELNRRNIFSVGQGATMSDEAALRYATDAALYKAKLREGYNSAQAIKCVGTIRYKEKRFIPDKAFRKTVQRLVGVARYMMTQGIVAGLKKGPATVSLAVIRDRKYYPNETAVGKLLKQIIPAFTA